MEHVQEIELIEFVADRLATDRAAAVRAHAEQCPQCAATLAGLRQTWEMLGAWEVPAGEHTVVDRVQAESLGDRKSSGWGIRILQAPAFRVAAVVALVAGLGYAAGRFSAVGRKGSYGPMATYLSVLGLEEAQGLSQLMFEPEPATSEGV